MEIDYSGCAGCGQRIRELLPDYVLRRRDADELYFYHVGCRGSALQHMLKNGGLEAWKLTYRELFSGEDLGPEEAVRSDVS